MPDVVRRRIAGAVTRLRVQRSWSRAELAKRAGLDWATVRRAENATGPIRIDTLTRLATGLGVPVERLIEPSDSTVH